MIGIDTNILARFYCDDPQDPEAARQRPIARRIMVESEAIFVPLTVILEFEWVMRAFYETEPAAFCEAVAHLSPHCREFASSRVREFASSRVSMIGDSCVGRAA